MKDSATKPIDVLHELVLFVGADSLRRTPGAIVARRSADKRELLRQLTSEDAKKMRVYWK